MMKGLENFHRSFIERYEYKPIPKKLYRPLLWILDIVLLASLWLLFVKNREWLGLGVGIVAGIGYFVVITRTRR